MPGFTLDLTIVLVIALVGAMLFLPQFVVSRIEAERRAKADGALPSVVLRCSSTSC
jgi:hypothetical protein